MDPFEALKSSTPDLTNDPFEALKDPAARAVPQYVDEQFKRERSWAEVEPELKAGGVDPEPYRQNYQLQEARKMQSGEGIGMAEAFTRSSIPFGSALYNMREAKKYSDARRRFDAGQATGEDAAIIARFERLEQLDAERNKTMGGKLVGILGAAPAIVGEAMGGGKLLGAAGKALGIAPAASTAGAVGQFAGRQAALTPLMPSLYLDQAAQRNLEAGRSATDIRGFPTAVGMAYAQNLVLGSLTRQGTVNRLTGAVPTMAGRSLARGAVGTAEMAGVDAAAGFADQFLSDQYKTNTKFGLIGKLADGEYGEALKDATVSTLGFALFAALHDQGKPPPRYRGPQPQTPGLVFDPFGRPQDRALPPGPGGENWQRKPAESPVVEAFVDAVNWMKRNGWTAEKAGAEFRNIRERFDAFVKANPGAGPAEARKLFEKEPPGPMRTFAERLADTLPETVEAREIPPSQLTAGQGAREPDRPVVRTTTGTPPKSDTVSLSPENRPNPAQSEGVTSNQPAMPPDAAASRNVPPAAPAPENAPGSPVAAPPADPVQPPAAGGSRLGGFAGELMNRFMNRGRVPQQAPEPPPLKRGKVEERREFQRELDVGKAERLMEGAALQAAIRRSQPQNAASAADPRQKMNAAAGGEGMIERVWNARVPIIRQAVGDAIDNPTPENIERARASVESFKRIAQARGMDPQKALDWQLPKWAAFEAEQDLKKAVEESTFSLTEHEVEKAAAKANEIARKWRDSEERWDGEAGGEVSRELTAAVRQLRTALREAGREGDLDAEIDRLVPEYANLVAFDDEARTEERDLMDSLMWGPGGGRGEPPRAMTREERQEQELDARGAEFREQLQQAQQEVNSEIASQLSAGRRQGKSAAAVRSEIESVIREADAAADRAGAQVEAKRQPAGAVGYEARIAVPGSRDGIVSHYEVRELDDVIASHKADPPHNLLDRVKAGEYPAGVQPRDYAEAGEVNKVWDNARQMVTGFFISNHPSATNGPPTIDPSGRVINGNGRQMSIEASTHVGTYERYRADLERQAAVYGLDPATVKGMKRPALYRVVDFAIDSPEAREFARLGNVGETQAQNPVRAAAAMADFLTPEMIRAMDLRGDETFSKAVNGYAGFDFRMKLYGRLPKQMRDTYFEKDAAKSLNAAGQEFVQNMMLAKILPVEMIQELQTDHKRLFQSIEGVVPALMKVATNPELDNVNIAPQLEEALDFLLKNPRVESPADASNALDQLDLFTGKKAANISPGGRMLLDFLLESGEKSRVFRDGITKIIAGERGAAGLFDDPNARFDIVSNASKLMGVKERPGARFGGPRGRKGAITLPTWDDLKKSNVGVGIRTAIDEWTKLRGSMFPEMNRANPLVADRAATLAAAVPFAERATHYVMKAVFGPLKPEVRAKFYTAHLETRLNYMASRGMNPISVIGPDSPIKTQAEYRAIVMSPAFRNYLDRWKQVVVPIMNRHFWDSQGMPHGTPIQTASQLPNYPVNLVRVRQDGSPTSVGTGGTRVRPERVTQRRLGYAKAASGESPFGYETDPEKALLTAFEQGMTSAARANLDRMIVETGVGAWARPGQPAPVTADGRTMRAVQYVNPQQGTQAAAPGQNTLYVDPRIHQSYLDVIGVGNQFRIPLLTSTLNAATRIALVSTVEASYHSANLAMQLTKPRMIRSVLRELLEAGKPLLRGKLPGLSEGQLERLMNLAEAGSTKAAGFQTGFLLPKSWSKADPTRWGAAFLDAVDGIIRLGSDRAFDSLAKSGLVANTPKNKRDFLNSVGNYLKDSQAFLVRALRGSGFGPFATAATNTPVHSIRSLWASAGMTATSPANQLRLRGHVLLKMAAGVGAAIMLNELIWGDPRGDETVPWGALKIGERNGRSYFVDPMRFMGPRRGMRVTGLDAAIEGEHLGASDAATIHKARKDIQHGILHPAMGPGTAALWTIGTGDNAMGTNVAGTPERGGTQEWENFKAMLKNVNPSVAQLIGADRVRPGEAMPLFPLTGKGEGVVGDLPEGEDWQQNAAKLFAPYVMSRKRLPPWKQREFMEEEAAPKREVPLRRR